MVFFCNGIVVKWGFGRFIKFVMLIFVKNNINISKNVIVIIVIEVICENKKWENVKLFLVYL